MWNRVFYIFIIIFNKRRFIMGALKTVKYLWKNRQKLSGLKDEVFDIKEVIESAKADKKITKKEMQNILLEVDDVLEMVIDLLD